VVCPGQFVGNADHSAVQAQHGFYYVVRKFGISKKKLGVVAHGLRHQKVNDVFGEEAGGLPVFAEPRSDHP
jgi:hypothetical protein